MKHAEQFIRPIKALPYTDPGETFIGEAARIARTKNECAAVWFEGIDRWEMKIPGGFLHDGASLPWYVRAVRLIDVWGPALPGSRVHDLGYRTEGLQKHWRIPGASLACNGETATMGRKAVDQVFRAFLELNYSKRRAAWAYRGVRLGGWLHWGGPVPELR